jgi:hypothetical protein
MSIQHHFQGVNPDESRAYSTTLVVTAEDGAE